MPAADRDDRRPRRVEDDLDDFDDLPAEPHRRPPPRGGDGFATVVPYRNGAALAAYYIGVFGLIPILGFVFGPLAFILGIIGLVKARKSPQAHGTGHAIAGIVLGVIDPLLWIVLLFVMRRQLV
jgi:Domain of unknown function (DUF4190)